MEQETQKIEISFTAEEYKFFAEFLIFADFLLFNNWISTVKRSDKKESISKILNDIYKQGIEKFNLSSSIELFSIGDRLPFSDQEMEKIQKLKLKDLDTISYTILSRKFAEQEINYAKNKHFYEGENGTGYPIGAIIHREQKYKIEFEKNGIDNLRFKFFHSLKNS